MYSVGLVVGKFCPLHRGHELVINTALAQCQQVVIISYTSLANAPTAAHRRTWLTKMFPTATVIVPEGGFPQDSDSEEAHRVYCYNLCAMLGLIPDAIFASETYLTGFAQRMSQLTNKEVTPIMVDLERIQNPISGTALRNDPALQTDWCSTVVNALLGKRVLFIGAESSGKTTIAAKSALHFAGATWVPEYGREMWDKREGKLQYQDMAHIGLTQVTQEEAAMRTHALVFCDTSPLVTKFYSKELFGRVNAQLDILAQREYDYVFWCTRDFGYVEDGTRNGVEFGTRQELFYKENLGNVTVLSGSVDQRINTIQRVLQLT